MQFFGLLAAILMIIALAMFMPVFVVYLKTGLVPNFPTLIVSGFIAMAALQSFCRTCIINDCTERSSVV